jgi:hypothetical protein
MLNPYLHCSSPFSPKYTKSLHSTVAIYVCLSQRGRWVRDGSRGRDREPDRQRGGVHIPGLAHLLPGHLQGRGPRPGQAHHRAQPAHHQGTKRFENLAVAEIVPVFANGLEWRYLCLNQGVIKRCRLSWWTNSALVYESKCRGKGGGGCGVSSSEYSHYVTRRPNKLWISNSIFNLWTKYMHTCMFIKKKNAG